MTNMWIVVLKDTALISLIGLKEIMAYAKLASGVTKEPFIYYMLASAFFLGMTWLTYFVSRHIEGWSERGYRPAVRKEAAHAL
jgi:ABC-type arginine transport system permease subunit